MNASTTPDDERYEAVRRRDPVSGEFFFGVGTTGIYCRPTCPARTPLRKNVRFFETVAAAERAGFRACKRCRPNVEPITDALAVQIDAATATIEAADVAPSLDVLAATAGVSPFHFQRAFKKRVGLSPKQYALALRERRLAAGLPSTPTVTAAALDAGYPSAGAIYDGAGLAGSMTPRAYRAGAPGEHITYAQASSSLGWMVVARTARGICAIELGDDAAGVVARVRERFAAAELVADDAALAADIRTAVAIVEGRAPASNLPIDVRGTVFQRRVWRELRTIAPGETRTYAEVARALGAPSAARAVANACASNAVAVAIPCHRVIRGDGSLGGYRWGIERKRAILERERKT